jgi:hypothetical protein
MTSPEFPERLLRLAAGALQHAVADDMAAAMRMTQRISDEFGGEGLTTAILGWCDALARAHPVRVQPGQPAQLAFTSVESGGMQSAAEVPPEHAWAGQLLLARALMDHGTCQALLAALPDDGAKVGDYVATLLDTVGLALREIRAGWAGEPVKAP